jgi:hypothetical protein
VAGIKDYSTTQANNIDLNGISVAEGMLPSNLNNAIRALMKNTREWFNDSQWVEYGDGSGAYTATYASATSFTIAGVDVTPIYHEGRRIKLTATTPGTIYGTISSSSFSTDTTINVTWDSGSLSNEAISNIYIGALSKTNSSIPTGVIATATLADGSVTTVKIADANVTNAKMATNAIAASNLQTDSVTNAKIVNDAVTTPKILDANVTTAKIADANITTAKIADSNVTTAKIAADAINGSKIADDSIDSEHYVDGSIDTQHIADSQITTAKIADSNVTTAKINDDAVTIDKIADAAIVTSSEQSAHTPDNNTFYTTSAADTRFLNKDTSELINSGQTWSASDDYIATTAAIDARVIDLVDDVGGFFPIENETSFPNTNPDVNDGAGTIVSIKEIATTRTPTAGVVTISGGTVGGSTVTINGCGSTVLTAGFGVLVETTTTLNTYTFHRLQPKATEVTTVASISGDITTVANNDSNITDVAGNAADISTVAGISADVTSVANIDSDVTAVANDATDIGTVAADLTGSDNIGTVATNIANVNNVGGSIANVNTVASNLTDVNNFADTYFISATAPTGGNVTIGDLWFDTSSNTMKVYGSSGWQNAGSSVNGTSERFTYTVSGTPSSVSGVDDNGNTLAYDAGFIDVYLNGVKMVNGTDVTVTSGTSVVFTTALSDGDIVDIVTYGTFNVASINATNITSGTLDIARIADGSITNAKLAGSITNDKLDGSISNDKLVNSSITINGSAVALGGSVTVGETKPTISSISPDTITNAQTSITITGSNFASVPQVEFLNPSTGIWYTADTVTFNNSTSLTVQATLTVDAQYKIRIENPDGNSVLSATNILTVSDAPTWNTAAGDLGTIAGDFSGTVATVSATSDSAVTYSETTSVLTNAAQANCSLNSSTGVITTTDFGGSSTTATTYNFTIRATDAEGQTADRSFSLTSSFGATGGAQFN